MRVDLALKYLCLAKSRSLVKHLCDEERISINSRPAKASSTVQVGDRISVVLSGRVLTVELSDIPQKQLSKSSAPTYYQVIEDYVPRA